MTEWRDIPGFEGYEVSEYGDVRTSRGRELRGFSNGKYLRVTLKLGGKWKKILVHRLVAFAFLGEPTGPIVRHLDDDQTNNHWSNLAYGTMADNKDDARRNGISRNGSMFRTHCPSGHPYSGANLLIVGTSGARRCRVCHNASAGKARSRRRAAARRNFEPGF